MKKLLGFIAAVIILTGCVPQSGSGYESVEPTKLLTVSSFDADYISKYECKQVWNCIPIKLDSEYNCPIVELTYAIFGSKSDAPVITSAKAYKYNITEGETFTEYGVNNDLKVGIRLGDPVATCLDQLPNAANTDSLFDLPKSMCKKSEYCTAYSLTGFQINDVEPANSYILGNDDTQTNGNTGGSDSWSPVIGDGNGYAVFCNDGSISNSGGIQGACSHHGGVSD